MPRVPVQVTVQGREQFIRLGRRLRDGDEILRRELRLGIGRIEPRIKAEIKVSALMKLPHRGGLARIIADVPVHTKWRFTGSSVGMRITAVSRRQIADIDRGRLRAPLYGNRRHWFTHAVKPGWFSDPTGRAEPKARDAVQRAMDNTARRIEGSK